LPKIFFLEPESDMHQTDHHRHFHQRPDHCCEGRTRVGAKHGNSQFEVVSGGGRRQGGGLALLLI